MWRWGRDWNARVDIWVPGVVTTAAGSVSVASYALRDGAVLADGAPVVETDKRYLQLAVQPAYRQYMIRGDCADVPLWSVIYDRGRRLYVAAVRTPVRFEDLLPLRRVRERPATPGPGVADGVVSVLGVVLSLPGGPAGGAVIPGVDAPVGIQERRIETFALGWDAAVETRTGGTVYAVTLSAAPRASSVVEVYRGGALMAVAYDYARAGATITFVDGSRPITVGGVAEVVTVMYTPG